jgi:hypothetical protein
VLRIKHWKVLKRGISDSNMGVGDVANCMWAEDFRVVCSFQARSYCWVHMRARSRILTYFISLLAIFFLLVVLMSHCFKCHSTCGRSFSAPSGLTRHQKSCSHWQRQLTLQSLHFKRAAEIVQEESMAKKIRLSTTQVSLLLPLTQASFDVTRLLQLGLHAVLRPHPLAAVIPLHHII